MHAIAEHRKLDAGREGQRFNKFASRIAGSKRRSYSKNTLLAMLNNDDFCVLVLDHQQAHYFFVYLDRGSFHNLDADGRSKKG